MSGSKVGKGKEKISDSFEDLVVKKSKKNKKKMKDLLGSDDFDGILEKFKK